MTVYVHTDIESSLEGDLEIDTKGDLSLANPLETHKAAANFCLRTDYGDYAPDKSVGCNLGSFMGKPNTSQNHRFMEHNINRSLKDKIFTPKDVDTTVVAFDINECLCVITIGGMYLIDGVVQSVDSEKIAYTFPFIGMPHLTPITVD